MLGKIKFLISYLLFWVVLFELARLVFILYNLSQTKQLSFKTDLLTFVYGLRMDISMASYILLPVVFFVLISVFVPLLRRSIIYKIYSGFILFFVLFITIADLELYQQWGFRIDATPLKYLSTPAEVWASVSHLPIFWIALLFLLVYTFLLLLTNKFIEKIAVWLKPAGKVYLNVIVVLFFAGLLVIPIRGGTQLTPINQSSVYFSSHHFANIAAINANWNFLHGVMNKTSSTHNPYKYLEWQQAKKTVDNLYVQYNQHQQVLQTDSPNVILIIWESFTDKATHLSVDGIEVTPHFNRLKKEGIYFSNIYASGDRTDKGISAVLSGYPALNKTSIVRSPNKSAKLPGLTKIFNQRGYSTFFYYGGETEFANIKSYISGRGFDRIIGKDDFDKKDMNSKWGAHDGIVANKLKNDTTNFSQPFFITWLTLSSHEPFETPRAKVFKGNSHADMFLNSMHYSDEVIGEFIEESKKQEWWKNTLVIIIADHGHPLPVTEDKFQNFKIPMLWLGGALNKTGVVVDKLASQLDLASTLTAQLGVREKHFPYGKNILDSTVKGWSFFTFNNGFGFLQPQGSFIFDNIGKQIILQNGSVTKDDINAGKSLQQVFFQDYLDK